MVNEGAQDSLIGTRILENFEIKKKLGEGGMGAVYLARNIKLGKRVAVKVILDRHANRKDLVDRFLNEARAVSALREEWGRYGGECNLADVLEVGRLPSGAPFMVQEYLSGQDLSEWLKRIAQTTGRVELGDVLTILAQVCCGLEAVHHSRIVHRDLKLSNLFVVKTFTNPLHIKILDFGLAKLSDSTVESGPETFEHAPFMGSLEYAAPEQARQMATVDARADLYSLGVIAYKLVCLRAPYRAKNVYDVGADEKQIIAPEMHRPDLPEQWSRLILAMLSHSPDDRPSSALSIAHTLADTLPTELGDGHAILEKVAPLLKSEAWIQRSRRMSRPELTLQPFTNTGASTNRLSASPPPKGETASYTNDDLGFLETASPTTLASAASERISPELLETIPEPNVPRASGLAPPPSTAKLIMIGAVVAGLALLAIVSFSTLRQPNKALPSSSTFTIDASAIEDQDAAPATVKAEPRTIDAGLKKKVTKKRRAKRLTQEPEPKTKPIDGKERQPPERKALPKNETKTPRKKETEPRPKKPIDVTNPLGD